MPPSASLDRALACVLCTLTVTLLSVAAAPIARAADDPAHAPVGTLSADGRTVTAAGRTLVVSQAKDLVAGQTISISGAGFHADKGIYVSLCMIPPVDRAPTPCVGGQDREGDGGGSNWISSNPPDYGVGLARPYGPGGTFSATVVATPQLDATLDCFMVQCAIVTRNDHTRSSDRSQDLYIPVSFTTAAPPSSAPDAPTTTMAPATTVPPEVPAPEIVVAADGLSVSDGTRALEVSQATELTRTRQKLSVRGEGFDPTKGIFVALCRVPEEGLASTVCTEPPEGSAWISSNPPDYGKDVAQPFGEGGSFTVTLTVDAVIDADTDCAAVACAITVRGDGTAGDDHALELALPVRFAEPGAATTTSSSSLAATTTSSSTPATTTRDDDDSGSNAPWIVLGVVCVAVLGGAGAYLVRQKRRGDTP